MSLNKHNYIFYNFLISYILLFGLINIEHYHFSYNYLFSDILSDKIKYLRSLIPFWLLFQFLFNKLILKIEFKPNFILNLLFLYVLLQIFGIIFSDENPKFNSFYILLYFSTLIVFYQINKLDLSELYYVKFVLIFVLLSLFFVFFSNNLYLFFTTNFSFYVEYPYVFRADINPSLYNPSIESSLENNSIYQPIMSEAPPRSSGISRIALIVSLFILIFIQEKKIYNFIFYVALIYLNLAIFITYSKINILSLVFLSSFIILFSKSNYKIKIIKFLSVIIIPLILTIYIVHAKQNRLFPFENLKIDEIEKKIFEERDIVPRKDHIFSFTGREIIWKDIILKTQNRWFIGNGPQADRYIVNQSASNSIFYAYSSGGIAASIIFFALYFNFAFKIIKLIISNKIKLIIENKLFYSSTIILIYLFMRSVFESSFAVFGIDLIIFITTFIIFDKKIENL